MTEIEIKITLPTFSDYMKVLEALCQTGANQSEDQGNFFFDTKERHLAAAKLELRLRLTSGRDMGCVTVKERSAAGVVNGLSTSKETEERVPASIASEFIVDPNRAALLPKLSTLAYCIVTKAVPLAALQNGGLVCIGDYKTHRVIFPYQVDGVDAKLKLELDLTTFPWGGDRYELEVEVPTQEHVTTVRADIAKQLQAIGVSFRPSTESKYAALMKGLSK